MDLLQDTAGSLITAKKKLTMKVFHPKNVKS